MVKSTVQRWVKRVMVLSGRARAGLRELVV